MSVMVVAILLLSLFVTRSVSLIMPRPYHHCHNHEVQQRQDPSTSTSFAIQRRRLGTSLFASYDEYDEEFPDDIDPYGAGSSFGMEEQDELSGIPTDEELMATMAPWDDKVARFNTIHLIGRLGRDPEPRYFDDGKVVVNTSLACKRKYHYLERKALDLNYGDEETDWYELSIWGQTAEYIAKYIDKGCRIAVNGSFRLDSWMDKETGERRIKPKVLVRDVEVLETRAESELRRSKAGGGAGNSRRRGGGSRGNYANNYKSNQWNDTQDDIYDPSSGTKGGFFD